MRTIVTGLVVCLLVLGSLPSHASDPELKAMAPDHVGLTLQQSPVLYFYISRTTSDPVRFTLVDARQTSPNVEVLLPSPTRAGWWPIRLKDYNIVLEPDLEYHWYVSITTVPGDRSKDIVARGAIARCPIHECMTEGLGLRCDKHWVTSLARYGIWYDAASCLNELIEANPQDGSLRRLRDQLLKDVGIILLTAN